MYYAKIAVMFLDLHPRQQHIDDLWQPIEHIQKRSALMNTLSSVEKRFGIDCVHVGYHSDKKTWQMKQQHRSPRYTTRWDELLCIDDSHMAVTQNK